MIGLIDCNNFFASCERVFNPSLNGRPIVVLSNNDGCVIARSEEVKHLGVKMGVPFYQIQEQVKRDKTAVFSSNYTLYSKIPVFIFRNSPKIKNTMFRTLILLLFTLPISCQTSENKTDMPKNEIMYTMPDESEPHEGTWLQWPHHYQYGITHPNRLDATWIAMTEALVESEKVHIIAYNEVEKERIVSLLTAAHISLSNIDFKLYPTDDVWIRDNGPIFVKDRDGKLHIEDWGFNGWGGKVDYNLCNKIPSLIARDENIPVVDLNRVMTNEGGAVEIDGYGTLMATKSAILNKNRNPGMTQREAEEIFTKYLGVTNFIWLNGVAGLEITDMHIDGFARFADRNTIVTMNEDDLLYSELPEDDIEQLFNAKNKDGLVYKFIELPLTKNDVITTYKKNLGYKGSYINFYVANTVVLVPNYKDENDMVANRLIQNLYPTRSVIGIDVRNLYANGGMVHCVTQQQPL